MAVKQFGGSTRQLVDEDGSGGHVPLVEVQGGGDASAANQTTEITKLTSIDSKIPASPSTTAKQDTGNTSLATIATNTTSAGAPVLAAGENHVGEVGGNTALITAALVVSTSPAYTAKDNIGGLLTLTGALRAAGKGALLNSLMLMDRSGQKPTGTVHIYNANPAAATITDNAAWVSSTDDAKIIAQIPIGSSDWVIPGATKAFAHIRNLGVPLTAASGTTLYASFETDSTPTFVATTDMQIIFGMLRD